MRVLMFCPQFAPVIGGAERQAEKLGKALISRGINVVVWTQRVDRASPSSEIRDGLPVRRISISDLSRVYPRFYGIGLINAPWIALQLAVRLWRAIGEADIVHCHIGCLQTVSVALVARLRRTPVICKAATADNASDLGEAVKAGVMGHLVAWLGRVAFHRWVATTLAVREALVRAGVTPARIEIIANGVNLPLDATVGVRVPIRRFLYLGRLSSNIQRDVPGLLRAFDGLAADVPDAELAIVGGGDQLEDTRERASACRHAGRILVTGPADAATWIGWADCFVLPSRREGLSNALLEAMAAGLPCIANDIPPNREVLAEGAAGVLAPVADVEALQRVMLRMTEDADFALSMAEAGHQRARHHFSIDAVSDLYECLYRRLIARSRKE